MDLIGELQKIVGREHVLADDASTRRYRTGMRFGSGPVAAVVRPGTLVEQWRVLQTVIAHGAAVIMQAANTGLTGGSTPDGDDYDRPLVIISTLRITGSHLIDGGRQVVCLPGTTLYELERILKPLGREPHSVIGSSCIGASVFGGICNNSGGALIHRGPAYTELALYAQLQEDGALELMNHLGIHLGNDPETILERIEGGHFAAGDVEYGDRSASDHRYADHVREVDADTPARFNADPGRLFEASGSAGKIMLLAVRLDTFEADPKTAAFYIGSNDPAELAGLRRDMLGGLRVLPVSAEYLHRDMFDIAERYGKDTFLAIEWLGTKRLPALYAVKARFDGLAERTRFLPPHLADKFLQVISRFFPSHLPSRLKVYRDRFEHHLMIKAAGDGIEEVRSYLAARFPSATGDTFECTEEEGRKAFLHRFAAAGAAIRYRDVHSDTVEDIVALDIALPRNTRDWFESLPSEITSRLSHRLYYGHFFCHVLHQDYIVIKGNDPVAIERDMCEILDTRGAEYPAEHNVGHLYDAKETLQAHYRSLDPCNSFNPGIGKLSRRAKWQ